MGPSRACAPNTMRPMYMDFMLSISFDSPRSSSEPMPLEFQHSLQRAMSCNPFSKSFSDAAMTSKPFTFDKDSSPNSASAVAIAAGSSSRGIPASRGLTTDIDLSLAAPPLGPSRGTIVEEAMMGTSPTTDRNRSSCMSTPLKSFKSSFRATAGMPITQISSRTRRTAVLPSVPLSLAKPLRAITTDRKRIKTSSRRRCAHRTISRTTSAFSPITLGFTFSSARRKRDGPNITPRLEAVM
mmetsp:Transcript_33657/g.94695  ORF Transcript_33657/g.94695 Transcript_33657/m.94695 type:complete len:240 (+) Transcript_33657:253-972(+)